MKALKKFKAKKIPKLQVVFYLLLASMCRMKGRICMSSSANIKKALYAFVKRLFMSKKS